MAGSAEAMLEVLLGQGLMSLVQADAELKIVAMHGAAAARLPKGSGLCDALPVLYGLDDAIRALHDGKEGRLVLTNVAMVSEAGASERQDFVVLPDPATGGYVLSITPSLANDDLTVELEQNLRKKLQLESRVAAQARAIDATNAALKRTNDDLVDFTRMISHDLKAPMRAIRYSAEDIGSALAGTEDETQLVALDELRRQSVRLSRMVTDLLVYSRLGDKLAAVATVDTDTLVREVAASIPRPAGLQLTVSGTWPVLTTVEVLLDVVLRNLIDNAVKHHDRETGLISVAASSTEAALEIVVSDDGPGIPEDYRQAILRPFVKINKDQHDTSGLGLSMVDKVISDIGGRLEIGDRLDGQRGARAKVLWPLTIVAS
ncbi:MAG: HAMP domain-containing histidine kinase [Hyphomicrobiaceae bacterium]